MATKNTILSEKEFNLLEDLVAKYGIIVNFNQIYKELEDRMSRQKVRNLVNKLVKNGWLLTIKKGIYEIASMESRGFTSLSTFKVAQVLAGDSYISFEAALQYYGMFDQHLRTITSVSLKRHGSKEIQGINYKFIKTKEDLFYGFEEKMLENYSVKIATCEKAILDLLNFKRNIYSVDLVLEKLKEYKKEFNFARLNGFSKKQTITVQKTLGFLFDKVGINSTYIYNLVGTKKNNYAVTTSDSTKFNKKWRLYYHTHLE